MNQSVLTIGDLETDESNPFILVTDSQDVEATRETIISITGISKGTLGTWLEGSTFDEIITIVNEFDSFFIQIEDGSYVQAYGFHGSVPYNDNTCYRLI